MKNGNISRKRGPQQANSFKKYLRKSYSYLLICFGTRGVFRILKRWVRAPRNFFFEPRCKSALYPPFSHPPPFRNPPLLDLIGSVVWMKRCKKTIVTGECENTWWVQRIQKTHPEYAYVYLSFIYLSSILL